MQARVRVGEPQAIERALGEQRQRSLMSAAPGMPPVRATALNLVVFAGTPARAQEIGGWVAALAEEHPMRALLLGREPGLTAADWDIHVWAQCHPALPGFVVCFEAVEIMARDGSLERLPALILSLLLRDLPVVLWWPDDVPMASLLFERLLANADRLLVDSASASDPEDLLRRLAALGHAEHCICATSDLNWERLTLWRELIAQLFDPPDCRPCLERIESVRIEFLRPPEHPYPAQAYLLAAWLASRLGWAPTPAPWRETPEGAVIDLVRGREQVSIELVPLAPAGSEELRRVVLRTGYPDGVARFAIERPGEARAEVMVALPGRDVRRRTVPFPAPATAALLSEELRRSGPDPIYVEALPLAAYLAAARPAP